MTIKGGRHLGTVREWMQRCARNGDQVTWGSQEELHFSRMLTPALFEQLAQDIRDAALSELSRDLKEALRVFNRIVETTKDVEDLPGKTKGSHQWDLMLLREKLTELVEDE